MQAAATKLILPGKKTAADLRDEMLKKIGDLSGVHVYHNFALGMIYTPDKVGSLFRSDISKDEDKWQGKVVLVCKRGPMAFVDSDKWSWNPPIDDGDFVVVRASEGVNRMVNGQMCRLFRDVSVTEKVDHPDSIY